MISVNRTKVTYKIFILFFNYFRLSNSQELVKYAPLKEYFHQKYYIWVRVRLKVNVRVYSEFALINLSSNHKILTLFNERVYESRLGVFELWVRSLERIIIWCKSFIAALKCSASIQAIDQSQSGKLSLETKLYAHAFIQCGS